MKKYFFFVIYCVFSTSLFAQKVDFERKTNQIMLDNVPIGKIFVLSESDKIETYSVKDMSDKEVILIKLHMINTQQNGVNVLENIAEYHFVGSGKKVYTTDVSNRKKFSKELVKHGVFDKKGFNPEGEKRMITLFSEKPALLNEQGNGNNGNTTQNTDYTFKLVERNKQGIVMVFGDVIKQEGQDLGNISMVSRGINGKVINVFTITNHLNTQIAEAIGDLNGNSIKVTTFINKNTVTINTETGDMNNKKAIAEYLVKNNIW